MPNPRIRFRIPAVALLLAGAVAPQVRAQSEPAPPRVYVLKGTVTLKSAGASAEIPATLGQTLSAGDQLATAANGRAEVQFDNRVLQLAASSAIHVVRAEPGAYRLAVGQGTVTCQVMAPPVAALELATPSVFLKPDAAGIYRIAVTGAGESEITAQEGNVEVFAPTGSVWLLAGQKMLARGPADNPEFRIVRAFSRWRRFLTVAMMSLQIAGNASAAFPSGGSGSRTAPKPAAAKPGGTNSAGARAPSSRPPSAPPASSGKGR